MSFVKRLFGGGGPSQADIQAQADAAAEKKAAQEKAAAEEKAAIEAKDKRKRRQGAAANIFTTPSGLSNSLLTGGGLSPPLSAS